MHAENLPSNGLEKRYGFKHRNTGVHSIFGYDESGDHDLIDSTESERERIISER